MASASDLEWVKDGNSVRFTISRTTSYVRMDMTSPPVMASDEGEYTCRNRVNMEAALTIYISAGEMTIEYVDIS